MATVVINGFQLPENVNEIKVNYITGNLISRFTDFLTADGEKEWRDRESEFQVDDASKTELIEMWRKAWTILENSLHSLKPEDMFKTITIRGVSFSVEEALLRSLAHFSYRAGQIFFLES
jgi:hypothetical protein